MRQVIFFTAARYSISLLHTALIACLVFSVSHYFKTDLLSILLAHILKKQFIKFINPALLLVLKRENIVQNFKQCVIYVDIVGFAKRLRL